MGITTELLRMLIDIEPTSEVIGEAFGPNWRGELESELNRLEQTLRNNGNRNNNNNRRQSERD